MDVGRIATPTGFDDIRDEPAQRSGPGRDGFPAMILFPGPTPRQPRVDAIDLPGHCRRGAVDVEVPRAFRLEPESPNAA